MEGMRGGGGGVGGRKEQVSEVKEGGEGEVGTRWERDGVQGVRSCCVVLFAICIV